MSEFSKSPGGFRQRRRRGSSTTARCLKCLEPRGMVNPHGFEPPQRGFAHVVARPTGLGASTPRPTDRYPSDVGRLFWRHEFCQAEHSGSGRLVGIHLLLSGHLADVDFRGEPGCWERRSGPSPPAATVERGAEASDCGGELRTHDTVSTALSVRARCTVGVSSRAYMQEHT